MRGWPRQQRHCGSSPPRLRPSTERGRFTLRDSADIVAPDFPGGIAMAATQSTRSNPLLELPALGQSIWLDFIRRRMLDDGELARLVAEDGIRGGTSNPSIFEKATASGDEYRAQIVEVAPLVDGAPKAIFEALAVEDIRRAADVLAEVHRATDGRDGFVSLEVAPDLAHDAAATIAEARHLWQ